LKSVLPRDFRAIILSLALLLCACASSSGTKSVLPLQSSSRQILNLQLKNSIGPNFDENGSFLQPAGVAVNQIGEIFISDKAANAIFKFSAQLQLTAQEGGIGVSLGEFNKPQGMACDAALNLYVADNGNKRIQVLDRNLHFVKTITTYFNENNDPTDFSSPGDITIDREGNLWIADNDQVLKLDPFFDLLLEISDRVPGNFIIGKVVSIVASKDGQVAIGDIGNHQVLVISTYGNLTDKFQTDSPAAIAWDKDGNIWIADSEAGRILAYDRYGNPLFVYAEENPASKPAGLAFTPDGTLVVVDSGLRKVNLYRIIQASNPPDSK
jgi:tripartite motif-containing protein 71